MLIEENHNPEDFVITGYENGRLEINGKIYQEAPVSCGIHSIAEIVYPDPYISLNIMALLESEYEKTMHPAGAFLPPMHHWWAHFPGKRTKNRG